MFASAPTLAPTTPLAHAGLNRLVAAAVVSAGFRQLLLNNPAQALHDGYNGTVFNLSADEKDLVLNIRASTLADFASQLLDRGPDRRAHGHITPSPRRARYH